MSLSPRTAVSNSMSASNSGRIKRLGLAGCVALGGLFAAGAAAAQTLPVAGGTALNQLEPSVAGDPFFGTYHPAVNGRVELRGYVMADFARQPLRFIDQGTQTAIVENQLFVRGDVSLSLADRFLIDVNMPVAVLQSGSQPATANLDFHPPTGVEAGDLRLAARLRIIGDNGGPFQLGLHGDFFIPTAPAGSYTGDGSFRSGVYLLMGGRFQAGVPFVWNVQGGGILRTSSNPSAVAYGGGIGAQFIDGMLQLGAEVYGNTWIGDKPPLSTDEVTAPEASSTSVEVLFGAKFRIVSGLQIGLAAGPGLSQAVGTPELRGLGMIAWSPTGDSKSTSGSGSTTPGGGRTPSGQNTTSAGGPLDSDGDGLNDDVDACPKEPGGLSGDPSKDGCPVSDKDKDGVEDVEDACPSLAGVRRPEATKNGCPDDTDNDGVYDVVDACPSLKGSPNADPKKNGCAADTDNDGIADAEDACPSLAGAKSGVAKFNGCPEDPDGDGIKGADDACPMDKGVASKDKDQNGCPDSIRVTETAILLRKPIEFVTYGKARTETIDPLSDAVLRQVKDAIDAHPEILKIEVQGHTDDSGSEDFNKALSQQRADAVRTWLVNAGVSADKLVAKGYGYEKPLGDNRIRTGRQKNRRVELVILERRK
ncbi:MAG: OmpA family protein [Polyangiaceae bacterium]|nr:OmpA family protein [Polyangiaceae bacterium]